MHTSIPVPLSARGSEIEAAKAHQEPKVFNFTPDFTPCQGMG